MPKSKNATFATCTFRGVTLILGTSPLAFKQVNYYAGILMRHDHPLHDMILSYYQDFLKHVPQLYTKREIISCDLTLCSLAV